MPVHMTRLLLIQRTLNPVKADKYKVNRICKYNVKQRIEKLTGLFLPMSLRGSCRTVLSHTVFDLAMICVQVMYVLAALSKIFLATYCLPE